MKRRADVYFRDKLAGSIEETADRLLALDRLLESLDMSGIHEFTETYIDAIERRLDAGHLTREAHWSESLAVGSSDFTKRCRKLYSRRWKFDIAEASGTAADTWAIKEPHSAYGAVCPPKTRPKPSPELE